MLSLSESELEQFLIELGNPELVEAVLLQLENWRTSDEIIAEAKLDPAVFRKHVLIQSGQRILPYQDSLDPWQRQDMEAMDPGWKYMARVSSEEPPYQRAYLERPRGHSKTTDIACFTLWAILSSNSLIHGYACASSEAQVKLLMKAVDQICDKNPWIADRLVITTTSIKNPLTGSVCEIVAANANAAFGETPNFIICDELTHWTYESVWTALFSGVAKVDDCFMVVISNAGYGKGRSWHWKVREKLRADPDWYFHSLNGPEASWITQKKLDEQCRILGTMEFRRLWLNKWLSNTTEGIPYNQVEAATVLAGPATLPHGYDYVIAAIDIGLVSDRASLVFLGISISRQRVGLLNHFTFRPKDYPSGQVRIADVEEAFNLEHRRLGRVDAIYADNWQAVGSLQKWDEEGIRIFEVQFAGKSAAIMAKRFVDAFRRGFIELYYDPVLENDILDIEIEFNDTTRAYRLKADRTEDGHADSGFALAMGFTGAWEWILGSMDDGDEDPMQADREFVDLD